MSPRALVSWSSGKDCAWALHAVREQGGLDLVGLLSTFNQAFDRVAMHGVRKELALAQAEALGLPLWEVPLPWPCSNAEYEERMGAAMARARSEQVTHVVFGDLFLEDVRAYREQKMAGTGLEPVFPLWTRREATPALAQRMVDSGLRAVLACVDSRQLHPRFAGRIYDAALLDELPPEVDPCGENGEFHTFCFAGPMFRRPLDVRVGELVDRDGFVFADITLA